MAESQLWDAFDKGGASSPPKAESTLWEKFDQEQPGNFMRGIKTGWGQAVPTMEGAVGLVGATAEKALGDGGYATKLKEWGLNGFQQGMEKLQPLQHENDDVTVAYKKAKEGEFGAMVDFVTYAFGYGMAQMAQTAAVGAASGIIGGALSGGAGAAPAAIAGVVEQTAAKGFIKNLVEREIAKRVAAGVTVQAATKSLASDIGAVTGLSLMNVAQEAGQIYPAAEEQATKEGKTLTGSDIARIWGSATVAGASETIPDVIGLGALTGRFKGLTDKLGTTRVGRTTTGALAGGALESGQEAFQTGVEHYGAGQPIADEEGMRDIINSAAMALVPGVAFGGAYGAMSRRAAPGAQPVAPADPIAETLAPADQILNAKGDGTLAGDTQASIDAAAALSSAPTGLIIGAQASVPDAELSDLIRGEAVDQQARLAEMQVERAKQAELDAVQAGTAPNTPQPPTAMAMAMQAAQKRAGQAEQTRLAQETADQERAAQASNRVATDALKPQPVDLPILQRVIKREAVTDEEAQPLLAKGFIGTRDDGSYKIVEKGLKARNFLLRQGEQNAIPEQGPNASSVQRGVGQGNEVQGETVGQGNTKPQEIAGAQAQAAGPNRLGPQAVIPTTPVEAQALTDEHLAAARNLTRSEETRQIIDAESVRRAQNPETRSSQPVAESQALGSRAVAPGPSDAGAAPRQVAALPGTTAPSPEQWKQAILTAETEWGNADRGQRSYIAEQAGYGKAQFGPDKKTLSLFSWGTMPPEAQRALGKRALTHATPPPQAQAAPPAAIAPAPVSKTKPAAEAPVGPEIERFQGIYSKGMNITPARLALKDLSAKRPELTWAIEKTTVPDQPDRFDVVGRKAQKAAVAAPASPAAQGIAKPEIAAPAPIAQGGLTFEKPVTGTYVVKVDGKEIGRANLADSGNYLTSVRVDKEFQRKGVANKLLSYVERDIGKKLEPSPTYETPDGKALMAQRGVQSESAVVAATKAETPIPPLTRINGQLLGDMTVAQLQQFTEKPLFASQGTAAKAELALRDKKGETVFGKTMDQLSDKELDLTATASRVKGVKAAARAEQAVRAQATIDLMAKLKEPGVPETLRSLANQAGWAERGGHLVRTKTGEAAGEEIITRTKWVPHAEWWPGRPVAENEQFYRAAVAKAIAGEKLTGKQTKVVKFLLDLAKYEGTDLQGDVTPQEVAQAGIADPQAVARVDAMATAIASLNPEELAILDAKSGGLTDEQFQTLVLDFVKGKQNANQRPNAQDVGVGQESGGKAQSTEEAKPAEVAPIQRDGWKLGTIEREGEPGPQGPLNSQTIQTYAHESGIYKLSVYSKGGKAMGVELLTKQSIGGMRPSWEPARNQTKANEPIAAMQEIERRVEFIKKKEAERAPAAEVAPKRYEYGLTLRPVSSVTVPKGFVAFGKNEKYPHGTVSYAKPLSRADIEHFDLAPLDPRDPINMRKYRDAIAAKIETILLRDGGVKGTFPSGHVYLLTETYSGDKPIRVTTFLPDGTPSGHREYDSINGEGALLDNAVSEFLDKDITISGMEARPALDLASQTLTEGRAKAAADEAAEKAKDAAAKKAEEDSRAAAVRKEIAQRSEVAPFSLDATEAVDKKAQQALDAKRAEDQLSGQGDVFAQPQTDNNFYYVDGSLGMKSDGSFTAEKRHWMTFNRIDAERMNGANTKPYGATRIGVFAGTQSGATLKVATLKTAASFQRSNEGVRDLIVRHNLTEANLLHSAKMGGIPVPALAVNRVSQPFDNFGEITLVGDKEMANPQGYANTRVFGSDVYSPRYPTIHYKFTPPDSLRAELAPGIEATGSKISWDDVHQRGPAQFENEPAIMWQFLRDKGINPDIVMEQGTMPDRMAELKAAGFEKFFPKKSGDYVDHQELMRDPEFQRLASDEISREYTAKGMADLVADKPFDSLTEAEKMNGARSFAYEMKTVGAAPEINPFATRDALRRQIRDKYDAEFNTFANALFDKLNASEKIFQGFTYAGDKKYAAHTLDKVVAILKKELRGGEGFNYGVGSLRAKFTPQFRSVTAIREAKGNLLGKTEFEAVKKEIDNALTSIWDDLAPYSDRGREFGFGDTVIAVLEDSPKMGITKALAEYGMTNVPDSTKQKMAEFLTRLRNMPTEYFEAKIKRAVDLAEFRGAAVPEGTSQKAIDILKERGLDVETYKKGDAADRQRAVKAIADRNPENVLFQRGGVKTHGITVSTLRSEIAKAFGPKAANMVGNLLVPLQTQADIASVSELADVVPLIREGDKVAGFYHPKTGKAYIVLENMTPDSVRGTVLHELGVHHGFRGLLGDVRYAQVTKKLDLMRKTGNKAVIEAYEKATKQAAKEHQIPEETIAYLVSNHSELPFVQRIIAEIKAFLFRKFGILGSRLTVDDIAALARASVLHASEGANSGVQFIRSSEGDQYGSRAFWSDILRQSRGSGTGFNLRDGQLADTLAARDRRTHTRGAPVILGESSDGDSGTQQALRVVRWPGSVAGQQGHYSVADQRGANFVVSFIPQSLAPNESDLQAFHSENIQADASILRIGFVPQGEGVYEVAISDPERGGSAFTLLNREGLLSPTGRTDANGQEYFEVHLDPMDASGLDLATEAVRRLAIYKGAVPTLIRPIRDTGAFDPKNPDIRFSRTNDAVQGGAMQAIQERLQPGRERMGKIADSLIYNFQDRFMDLRRIQARVGAVPENMDASLAEERYSSKVAAKAKDFIDDSVNPMLKAIHEAKLKYEEVESFLHALHAPSRNAAMQEINPTASELTAKRATLAETRDNLAKQPEVNEFIDKRRELRQVQADVEDGIADESAVSVIENEIAALRKNPDVREYSQAIDELRALKNAKPFEGDNTALSGMSDEEAQGIISKAELEGKLEALQGISAKVDAITAKTRQIYVDAGLEKPETIAAWGAKYKHYVPLHRDEVAEGFLPPTGQGFNVRGRESKRATGSQKQVTDILAHVVAQHEAAIIRAEKQVVDKALFEFAQAHQDESLWELDTAPTIRTVDPVSGLAVNRVDPLYKQKPNVLTLKIDGEEHTITFNEKNPEAIRLAVSMKNLSASDLGEVTKMIGNFTRLLATMNTSANPVFLVRNFLRDAQTAFINLSDSEIADRKKEVFKNIPAAIRGFWNMSRGNFDSEYAKHAREFRDAGGQIGWMEHYKDIGARAQNLKAQLEKMGPGKWNWTKREAEKWWGLIDQANAAVENGVRLSAYVAARKAGLSEGKAASISKNLTVNFNRRGAKGVELNMWYMFMNASIQGTARTIKAMGNKNVQKILGYTVASGFMLALLAQSMAGDDDKDGENDYDQLPEYVKANNFVFWAGNRPITIPMPYGYNFFASIGRKMEEAMFRKNYSPVRAAADLATVFIDAFNPMNQSGSLLQFAAPTIADPFVQWAENKNFASNPLRKEQMPFGPPKPEFKMGFKSTSAPAKWLAEVLNTATGGNDIRPGAFNLNPGAIDFGISSVAGGAGRTYLQMLSLPMKLLTGDEVQAREVPFVNIFASAKPEYQVQRKYFENLRNVETAAEELKRYHSDPAMIAKLREEHAADLRLVGMAKITSAMLRKWSEQENRIEKAGGADRQEQEKKIEERKAALMSRFNNRYTELRP